MSVNTAVNSQLQDELVYARNGKLIPASVLEQKRAAGRARAKQFTSESQREAGKALKSQVSKDWFKTIGLLGYRCQKFNLYRRLAQTYDIRTAEGDYRKEYFQWCNRYGREVADRKAERWNEQMRQDYNQEAERYSPAGMHQRWIMEFFRSENDAPPKKRTRKAVVAQPKPTIAQRGGRTNG